MATTKRRVSKKMRKVTKNVNGANAGATNVFDTIHNVTDPGTLKRVILQFDMGSDAIANDEEYTWGVCLTNVGETLPDLTAIETQEDRWLVVGGGLAQTQSDGGGTNIHLDSKIQRKMKAGQILTLVTRLTTAGFHNGYCTIFIDET